MPDETVDTAASVTEQPAGDAADNTSPLASETTPESATAETSTAVAPEAHLWAGKYTSPEELEKGYLNATAESSRMAAELSAYKRGPTPAASPAKPEAPKYSVEQLEYAKQNLHMNLAAANAAGDQAKASEVAGNLVWCDREIRRQEMTSYQNTFSRQSAEQSLMGDASAVLKKYQVDLQPGNPLYEKAASYHAAYLQMGLPDTAIVQAQAVALAANLLGKDASGAGQQARKELSTSLNQALKQAVQTGAGKPAAKASATPDFLHMSDDEFTKWKSQRGL